MHVQGRRFPVEVLYTAAPHADSLDAAVTAALQVIYLCLTFILACHQGFVFALLD